MADKTDSIDTQQTRVIKGSLVKLVILLIGSIGFMLLCLAAALGWMTEASETDLYLGLAGAAFFLFLTVGVIMRLANVSSSVVELSADGIWDHRVTKQMVLWRNVTEISIWTHLTGKFIQLTLDTDTEKQLIKSPLARGLRLANKVLGFSGIAISAGGLDTDTETLAALCDAYWRANTKS